MVWVRCLSTSGCLEELGRGHTKRCASRAVTYFAYDQWDMLHYGLYSGLIPSILAHHLLLLICFTLALYRNMTINYLILTLICKMHSIFLHVRKIRRMAGVRDAKSNIVKVEWVLNWVTFTFARVIAHVLITAKLIFDAHKFGRGVELPVALLGMFWDRHAEHVSWN